MAVPDWDRERFENDFWSGTLEDRVLKSYMQAVASWRVITWSKAVMKWIQVLWNQVHFVDVINKYRTTAGRSLLSFELLGKHFKSTATLLVHIAITRNKQYFMTKIAFEWLCVYSDDELHGDSSESFRQLNRDHLQKGDTSFFVSSMFPVRKDEWNFSESTKLALQFWPLLKHAHPGGGKREVGHCTFGKVLIVHPYTADSKVQYELRSRSNYSNK